MMSTKSFFAVTEFAAAAIGVAGDAAAELVAAAHGTRPRVAVDRRRAFLWFGQSIAPIQWNLPPAWDALAGDYEAADGWIRLHTNAPHHRAAALSVLEVEGEKAPVAAAVKAWKKTELETAVVAAGGCAAAMHSRAEWMAHPQGRAVAAEPLFLRETTLRKMGRDISVVRERPLQGVRVLDLTRILAGPVATRFLAGLGADVLRIDPPRWDEPSLAPEVTLGKRCARLDLHDERGRETFVHLLSQADVLVHGYRPGALDGLGFDAQRRAQISPGLIDVSLDAYGWSGPWQARRGFDSLVQMSAGIAEAGMRWKNAARPVPLPVQALDHATGYFMAAAVLSGLAQRLRDGSGVRLRTSLARVACELFDAPRGSDGGEISAAEDADFAAEIEQTAWGPARRLKPPLTIDGTPIQWELPAGQLGARAAEW